MPWFTASIVIRRDHRLLVPHLRTHLPSWACSPTILHLVPAVRLGRFWQPTIVSVATNKMVAKAVRRVVPVIIILG